MASYYIIHSQNFQALHKQQYDVLQLQNSAGTEPCPNGVAQCQDGRLQLHDLAETDIKATGKL